MPLKIYVIVWFVWALGGGAAGVLAQTSSKSINPDRDPFDPSQYIEYQEFKARKALEINLAKLRYKILEIGGVEYVQLQSDKGTIVLPTAPGLSEQLLAEARCMLAAPIAEDHTSLTKGEADISKDIEAYSGSILATIETFCVKAGI